LKLWLILGKVTHQLAIQKDTITFDNDKQLDLEDLLQSVEDRVTLDELKDKEFEVKQKYEEELNKLKEDLSLNKKKQEEIQASVDVRVQNEEKKA